MNVITSSSHNCVQRNYLRIIYCLLSYSLPVSTHEKMLALCTCQLLISFWSKFSLWIALSLCFSIFISILEFILSSSFFLSKSWWTFSSYWESQKVSPLLGFSTSGSSGDFLQRFWKTLLVQIKNFLRKIFNREIQKKNTKKEKSGQT